MRSGVIAVPEPELLISSIIDESVLPSNSGVMEEGAVDCLSVCISILAFAIMRIIRVCCYILLLYLL